MKRNSYQWAVIGAGPAGIAAVGKLLDAGIQPQAIVWIDPAFKVGDFGARWHKVSSNTKVGLFLKFFRECQAFDYAAAAENFAIEKINPEETCFLALAAEPLQWITNHLKEKVVIFQSHVKHLTSQEQRWEIKLDQQSITAEKVILATGSEPKSLTHENITEIPLTTALHPELLNAACEANDTIAVFGAAHSAILILKSLVEQNKVKKIINFYLSPLRYAVYYDDWILYDNTGLKGIAAVWAKKNIDGELPEKLVRVKSDEENLKKYLPQCNKAIYATGFKTRHIPVDGALTLKYCDKTGVITPNLFGLGIAYPEAHTDRQGNFEYRVGLWKFMDYLNRVMPAWLQ